MADQQPANSSAGPQEDAPLAVNLHIVSPSAGVGNLRFPGLPATTTIQQLRERIRESLPSRPADDHQRLIHRGRLLARDTDTLQNIFGEDAVRPAPSPMVVAGSKSMLTGSRGRFEQTTSRRSTSCCGTPGKHPLRPTMQHRVSLLMRSVTRPT